MKHYLVTGANGWLRKELKRRLDSFDGEYCLDAVSLRDESWKDSSWSDYDGVFHFAVITEGKDAAKKNAELTGCVAKKCVEDGVSWMLLLSSFHVYDLEKNPNICVNRETVPSPVTEYGKGKLLAEKAALKITKDTKTKLAIVRSPLVYGPGQKKCNFNMLMQLSKKVPLFPETKNCRSMIFSQNLCEFCRLLAVENASGLFLPQDKDYFDTALLVRKLGELQGKAVRIMPGVSGLTHWLTRLNPKFGKLFGSARYEKSVSDHDMGYCLYDSQNALAETVLAYKE